METGGDAVGVAALPGAWRDDPLLAGEHTTSSVRRWWADDDAAVLVLGLDGRPPAVVALGSPAGAAQLLTAAADDGALIGSTPISVPRGTWELADPALVDAVGHLTGRRTTWDWMCIDQPVVGGGSAEAVRLPADGATADAVRDCLRRAHPEAGTAPDEPRALGWWAVRDGDRLVAVVGAVRPTNGPTPRLVSLGVDPDRRGGGLAGAVLSAAVRDLLAPPSSGAVSIALYAENEVARRVYLRHGFVLRHGFETRRAPRA